MKERSFLFGEPKILLGIVSEPDVPAPPQRPVALILNAGLVHRVGPHRMSVRIARELAAQGFASLRFDLSGVGDSEPRRDNLSYEERALLDVREEAGLVAPDASTVCGVVHVVVDRRGRIGMAGRAHVRQARLDLSRAAFENPALVGHHDVDARPAAVVTE